MSYQVTWGSKRVAKTIARRLRLTDRSPLPWPLPVTPLVLRVRAAVDDWILDLSCFAGERRTTVVHFGTSTSCRDDTKDVDTELAASIGHCDPSSGVGSTAQVMTASSLSMSATSTATGGSVTTTGIADTTARSVSTADRRRSTAFTPTHAFSWTISSWARRVVVMTHRHCQR